MSKLPYERIIAWVAGPFAVIVGVVATKLVAHLGFLGGLGLQSNAVAHGIVAGVVFLVSAGVTFAAHHKWLTNLAFWWSLEPTPASVPTPAAVKTPVTAADHAIATQELRNQLRAAGLTPSA